MGRKKTIFKDLYASTSENDNYGTLFNSMCKSKAYQSLSLGAKQFYSICRVQARSEHGRRYLTQHAKETNANYSTDRYFVFPASHLSKYGYDRRNSTKYFHELEEAGFIKTVEQNKHTRKQPNVYCFSDKWKDTG